MELVPQNQQSWQEKNLWSKVLQTVLLWAKASSWRRASKCKSLVKRVEFHLAVQKTRKEAMKRQSRADIAQLLHKGRLAEALGRAEQLYKDDCLLSAYDQINQSCQCIITNISLIRTQGDIQLLPHDVKQALSNLIFAASRCGDLPELHTLRSLFKERYGCRFDVANVDLLPGNLVDPMMMYNLCVHSVPDDTKLGLINEIAQENSVSLPFQDFGQSYRRHQYQEKAEVLELEIHDLCSDSDESSVSTLTSGFSMPKKIKNNRNRTQNREELSTSTSLDCTTPIRETSVVYLDDLKVKPWNQEHSNGSSTNVATKRVRADPSLRKKSLPEEKQFQRSSNEDFSSGNRTQKPGKNRRSLDSCIDEWREQIGSSSASSHVHPKLPNYEDVVTQLTDLKAEYRKRRSFYY